MNYQNIVQKIKIKFIIFLLLIFLIFYYMENLDIIKKFIDKNININTFNLSPLIYNELDINDTFDKMIKTDILNCYDLDITTQGDEINDCKNNINNCLTNFITSTFFSDDDQTNIYNFQYLINNLFNTLTKNIIYNLNVSGFKLKETDIIFLYKGGTTLKILYDTYKSYFTHTENEYFYSLFSESFIRSDSDYVIMINPYITKETHGISFEYIYRLVNYYVSEYLYNISVFLYENNILKRDKITSDKLDLLIKDINLIINEFKLNFKNCQKYTNIHNIKGIGYIGITPENNLQTQFIYPDNKLVTEDRLYQNLKSNLFILTNNNKNKFNICFFNNEKINKFTDINLSINDANIVKDMKNEEIISEFCLQRLKIKFIIYYLKNNDDNIYNLPVYGELVDIVILKQNTLSLRHFYDNIENPRIKEYTLYNYNDLYYYSYTINGHIDDLLYILFTVSPYPWSDNKYEKRLKRLIFLLILNLYNNIITSETQLDKNKNSSLLLLLLKLFEDINNIFNIIIVNKENIFSHFDRCLFLINQFLLLHDKFIFILKLKDLFEKIKINLSFDIFKKLYNMIYILNLYFSLLNKLFPSMIHSRYDIVNVQHLGGNYHVNYQKKYIKYKQKYLNLKYKYS